MQHNYSADTLKTPRTGRLKPTQSLVNLRKMDISPYGQNRRYKPSISITDEQSNDFKLYRRPILIAKKCLKKIGELREQHQMGKR